MTMITPERTESAAKRLQAMTISHPSLSECPNLVLEEKKSMDDEDDVATNVSKPMGAASTQQAVYRNMVSNEPGSKFLPEKGRYVLYVSRACPNSHCALLGRTLKGLEDIVVVQYVRAHPSDHLQCNWSIAHEIPDDSLASLKSDEGEFRTLRDIYMKQNDNISNSIPLLYDQELKCIVNNNANGITAMLNSAFNSLATNPTVDLFSQDDKELEDWLYPLLQLTPSNVLPNYYDVSVRQLEFAFSRATVILQKQRYLLGNTAVSVADLRLFAALIRYDAVYARYLESPPQLLHNPVLMDYCRDLYQLPGVKATVCIEEIQKHFLGSGVGCGNAALLQSFQVPHKRDLLM